MRETVRNFTLAGYKIILSYDITIGVWNVTRTFIRNFFRLYFPRVWFCFKYRSLDRRIKEKDLVILVFQMGKVGSRTITRSLEVLDIPTYHVHNLVCMSEEIVGNSFFAELNARYIYKHLIKGLNCRKLKIISLVREPVVRNISAFFARINTTSDYLSSIARQKSLTLENLLDIFQNYFPHDQPLTWFDMELKPVFGIDVYNEPFPQTQGYKIYTGDHPDLLLLKLETLNDCAQEAFEKFLGIENFTMLKANIARHKAYYPLYQHFLSAKLLPQPYIERMYASKYARHFYTEEELNRFQKNWVPQTTNESEYD
ncbi:MAG: putative capsular polysaccharide synthesis family protein [Candidatus Hodarchaeota archaeon]